MLDFLSDVGFRPLARGFKRPYAVGIRRLEPEDPDPIEADPSARSRQAGAPFQGFCLLTPVFIDRSGARCYLSFAVRGRICDSPEGSKPPPEVIGERRSSELSNGPCESGRERGAS